MSRSVATIVPPKAPTPTPLQEWVVCRQDPTTGDIAIFEVRCAPGKFPRAYALLGLVDGDTLFDLYKDVDEGRCMRALKALHRR